MSDTTQLSVLVAATTAIALTILSTALGAAKVGFESATTRIEQSMGVEAPACPPPAGKTNGDTP